MRSDPRSFVDVLPKVGDGFTQTEERVSDLGVAGSTSQLGVLTAGEHGLMQPSRLQVVLAL